MAHAPVPPRSHDAGALCQWAKHFCSESTTVRACSRRLSASARQTVRSPALFQRGPAEGPNAAEPDGPPGCSGVEYGGTALKVRDEGGES